MGYSTCNLFVLERTLEIAKISNHINGIPCSLKDLETAGCMRSKPLEVLRYDLNSISFGI
ncbi:hypothetical protein D3C71_2109980 [compost metagenome]